MDMNVLQTLVGSVVNMTLRAIAGLKGLWRSSTTPPNDADYSGWIRPGTTVNEYLINLGTQQDPNWTEVATLSIIEDNFLYPTHEKLNGKHVWAVRYNVGSLPNSSTKSLTIPTNITSIWGPPQERCIDSNNTYAYDSSGNILPMPYISSYNPGGLFTSGSMNSIVLELNNNIIRITTQANRSGLLGIVTIKFTRG